MANQVDMVLQLLRAIQQHGPKPPARLSPLTEHAYAQAEAMVARQREEAA
jgi:hypothetical protein